MSLRIKRVYKVHEDVQEDDEDVLEGAQEGVENEDVQEEEDIHAGRGGC